MKINIQTNPIAKTKTVAVQKVYADQTVENREDIIVCEHLLKIFVNEREAALLVCTPSDLAELVLGRLLTEGFITDAEDVESLSVCETGKEARVFLREEASASLVPIETARRVEPTCCTDNKLLLKNAVGKPLSVLPEGRWRRKWIFAMAQVFAEDSKLHRETKGTHSCYLGMMGEAVFHSEDIGRHNAMDKCIGYAVRNELDRSKCILFTTGRVPTDMVEKAIAAGIPVLVSKAVPTDAAIAMAEEYHLTLICKAWPDSFVLCTPML